MAISFNLVHDLCAVSVIGTVGHMHPPASRTFPPPFVRKIAARIANEDWTIQIPIRIVLGIRLLLPLLIESALGMDLECPIKNLRIGSLGVDSLYYIGMCCWIAFVFGFTTVCSFYFFNLNLNISLGLCCLKIKTSLGYDKCISVFFA